MGRNGDLVPESPLFWTLVAATVPVAAAVILWASKKTYDVIPYQYQYRPGTISGWLAGALSMYAERRRKSRPIRVYMDGCFDMMHYGHANALRQARALGDELVVGLVPDSEILRCKGPPVMNEEERYTLVDSVKWADEVITGVPYDLSPEFIERLFNEHKIDYIIHGDDPCLLPDGTDAYAHAKQLGRFLMIKRTEGVSTTDLVGRMLTCTRVNHWITSSDNKEETHPLARQFSMDGAQHASSGSRTTLSRFLPTSRRLVQFSNGKVAPPGATIVYIDGAFDVFHPGHVKILKEAQAQGDFLLVGLHTDEEVQERRGPHLPIMNCHERSLSVLACKYVDEVIIGAPPRISEDLIKTFNIGLVVRGSRSETSDLQATNPDRYAVARAAGIFRQLHSPSDMTARTIICRIVDKRAEFEARNSKKVKSENAYYSGTKTYVKEL